MDIQVRHDQKRGCGWRKSGGLYLISGGLAAPCGRLPIPLSVCPTCHSGIKPSRGWTWIDGTTLLKDKACGYAETPHCVICPLHEAPGQVGLLWIGEKHYATPSDFEKEANAQGISRRIPALPNGFKLGETWVWLAHRKAVSKVCPTCKGVGNECGCMDEDCIECNGEGWLYTAAVFQVFKPTAVEYVVTGKETDSELDHMTKRGITPIHVERIGETRELIET